MIYGIFQTLQEDTSVLNHWIKGEKLPENDENENLQQRVQLAAWRMFGLLGMVFASLWVLSFVAAIITFPLMIGLQLATVVGIYVLGHDIFVMNKNASQEDFKNSEKPSLIGLLSGQESFEEELAEQFTHGTFLQSMWMSRYANGG